MSQPLGVVIRGMGASVPDEVLDNEFFAVRVGEGCFTETGCENNEFTFFTRPI